MRSLLFIASFLFWISASFAQKKAVTETGEEVLLYSDGTWAYAQAQDSSQHIIPTNPQIFKKDAASSFLLKSKKLNVGFWLNTKNWNFKKATENSDAEYELEMKDGTLYAMIITEKFEIPLESMKVIALENGKKVAPDLYIEKEEYRNVNGLNVLFLQMNGTMSGVKFSYYGYYFSNANGTIQFITYTAKNLLGKHLNDCDKLLNGLVELN